MHVLAVANQKGGAGKTTTAVHLAAAFAEQGRRVLLVDLDPQGSASAWLGVMRSDRALLDALVENTDISELITETPIPNVSMLPSTPWLGSAERDLAGEVGAQNMLRTALEPVASRFDVVVIDTPPSLQLLTVMSLAAADGVLIPVEARILPLAGLAALMSLVERVQGRLNKGLEVVGVLLTRVDRRTRLSGEVEQKVKERFGALVLAADIPESVRLAEVPSHRATVFTYAPDSSSAGAYRSAAREAWRRLTSKKGAAKG